MASEPRPVNGRYHFMEPHSLQGQMPTWFARDEQTGARVLVGAVRRSRSARYEQLAGVKHERLAGLVEVVHDVEDESLPEKIRGKRLAVAVVAEYVDGELLIDRLQRGALHPRIGVETIGHVTSAVAAMHTAGLWHGAISPRNIVYKPAGGEEPPILAQFLAPASAAYCSPERIAGEGPSQADDVWALYTTLYATLTRRPPFSAKSREELLERIKEQKQERLSDLFLDEDDLQQIIDKGLKADPGERQRSVYELDSSIEGWLEDRTAPRPEASMLGVPDPITGQIIVPSLPPSMRPLSLPPGAMPEVPSLDAPRPASLHDIEPGQTGPLVETPTVPIAQPGSSPPIPTPPPAAGRPAAPQQSSAGDVLNVILIAVLALVIGGVIAGLTLRKCGPTRSSSPPGPAVTVPAPAPGSAPAAE